MNIVISALLTPSQISGVGRYTINLIDSLQRLDHENNYYILVNDEIKDKIHLFNPRFKFYVISLLSKSSYISKIAYFFWQNYSDLFLKKIKPDLIHLPNSMPLFRKGGIPYVITIHDVCEFTFQKYSWFRTLVRKKSFYSCARIAKLIITVSNFSKKEIESNINTSKSKIRVVSLGVDKKEEVTTSRFEYFGSNYFLVVGGYRKNKNLTRILHSFSKINNKDFKLLIVGLKNKSFTNYLDLSVKLGLKNRVIFLGYVDDEYLNELYENAFALLFPSLYEGFGLPILEAMAKDTPVITSNIAALPEIGGDAVLYVDPYDESSIFKVMANLVNDDCIRKNLIIKGRARVSLYSWYQTARDTIKIYEELNICRT